MIDVVFSASAYGSISAASKLNNDNPKEYDVADKEPKRMKFNEKFEGLISLDFCWNVGFLNKKEGDEYRMKIPASMYLWHYVRLHPDEEELLLNDGINNLKNLYALIKLAERNKSFRIWHGANAMEKCGFLYVCNIFEKYDVDIYSVDVPRAVLIKGKEKTIESVGMAKPDEIETLVKRQRKLSKEEISFFSGEWDKLVGENSLLRAFVSDKIISVSEDFYDALIMECFREEVICESLWISRLVALEKGVESGFFSRRIWEMHLDGRIDLIQDSERMSERIWKKIYL